MCQSVGSSCSHAAFLPPCTYPLPTHLAVSLDLCPIPDSSSPPASPSSLVISHQWETTPHTCSLKEDRFISAHGFSSGSKKKQVCVEDSCSHQGSHKRREKERVKEGAEPSTSAPGKPLRPLRILYLNHISSCVEISATIIMVGPLKNPGQVQAGLM